MTAFNLSSRIQRPVQQVVSTRKVKGSGVPSSDEVGGWKIDWNLRCEDVKWMRGPGVGRATFTHVPTENAAHPFEAALADYSVDDQVQVAILPFDDELAGQAVDDQDATILFEGILGRPQVNVTPTSEVVTFDAFAMPVLDNINLANIITGRYVPDEAELNDDSIRIADKTYLLIDSPDMPAAFNFRGRPNMHNGSRITASWDSGELVAKTFTHDDDGRNGRHWTVRDAINFILVIWIYGKSPIEKRRHFDLDQDTLTALSASGAGSGQFAGIEAKLPEVNIQNLGPLDALERICKMAGFDFAIEPTGVKHSYTDRVYILRLWRRGAGPINYFDLPKRGTTFGDNVTAAIQQSNVNVLKLMRDGEELVNEVTARGQVYVEATHVLKPLWFSDQESTATVDAALQNPADEDDDQWAANEYFMRHHPRGSEFDTYRHVGRKWGLDCTGRFRAAAAAGAGTAYTGGVYEQSENGYDFATEMNLTAADLNLFWLNKVFKDDAFTIKWSRRVRRALPLMNTTARELNIQYLLEVSEDAGSTWKKARCKFEILRDNFGIFINEENLTNINAESPTSKDNVVLPDESWWALIKSKQLLFRLTCAIVADNGLVYNAKKRATAGSRYSKGRAIEVPVTEVWQAPNTQIGNITSSGWQKVAFVGEDNEADKTGMEIVQGAAERKRDQLEDARITCDFRTWVMDFGRYEIGHRIKSIRGRNFPLGTGTDDHARFPTVVGLRFVLGKQQSLRLQLEDEAMLRRYAGGVA